VVCWRVKITNEGLEYQQIIGFFYFFGGDLSFVWIVSDEHTNWSYNWRMRDESCGEMFV
jgi:hypothetical protein